MQLDPESTAVLTMELQRGICGDLARFAMLRDAVASGSVAHNVGLLLEAARSAGAPVIHCTFSVGDRTDWDLPLLRPFRDDADYLRAGTAAVELLPELGPEPGDVVIDRHHGVSPFAGTSLDAELRALGVRTVVVTGVSLNVGIPGTVIEAVNHGYRVVVVTGAVAGVPDDYAESVLRHTIAPIARLTDRWVFRGRNRPLFTHRS